MEKNPHLSLWILNMSNTNKCGYGLLQLLLQKSNLITLRMDLKWLLEVIGVEPFHLSQLWAKNVKHWQKMLRNHFLILSKQNKSVNSKLTNFWNGSIARHLIGSWSFISLFQLTDRYWPQKSWWFKADMCLLYASLQLNIWALTQQGPVLLTTAVLTVQNGLVWWCVCGPSTCFCCWHESVVAVYLTMSSIELV